jgi:hypothetical protein
LEKQNDDPRTRKHQKREKGVKFRVIQKDGEMRKNVA